MQIKIHNLSHGLSQRANFILTIQLQHFLALSLPKLNVPLHCRAESQTPSLFPKAQLGGVAYCSCFINT